MRLAKAIYFGLCFAILCVFFYFFCNTDKTSSYQKKPSSWIGYESLVAYSDDSRTDTIKCDNISSSHIAGDGIDVVWQSVPESKIFLYSAFIDKRKRTNKNPDVSYVRILGMSKGTSEQSLYCQIWYNDNDMATSRVHRMEIWVSSWDLANSSQYYRPYVFSCPLRRESQAVAVSVSLEPCQEPKNLLRLKKSVPNPENNKKKDFVICLKAMDFDRDLSLRLIEWAELQFLLGADKISSYVYRIHPNMMRVLEYYRESGRCSIKRHVLPGNEPNDPYVRTRYFKDNVWQKRRHEIIPYNDCFYEHVDTHNFVVNLDLDEAIVPVVSYDWSEMLDDIFDDHKMALNTYSSLSAANVYFFDSFGEYEDDPSIPGYMHMLRHVYRSANFTSPGFAVKSFHATNNTLAVFNHYTLFPLYPNLRRNALIGRHLAQMHHYRATCPPLMEKECQTNYMKFFKKDTVLWKYKNELVSNVRTTAHALGLG